MSRRLDAVFVNAPLRDYTVRPRINDFTLPVLGMGYIATYAKQAGFNVGVLDAEARGLGIAETIATVNFVAPRWVGFNLLAPTYEISAQVAAGLDGSIKVMLGGHQAKAMPTQALNDPRFRNVAALVLGEGETRVAALLDDHTLRASLPQVMWRDPLLGTTAMGGVGAKDTAGFLAPPIDDLTVDRTFLTNDPYRAPDGQMEANMVGARGCPYNCSFCGAAVSANPDITIRTRTPANIIAEMDRLADRYAVTAFRFVDDLFLGYQRFIDKCMTAFTADRIGERYDWDATGRINILDRMSDEQIDTLQRNGLREVALGVESGSARVLKHIDKRTNPEMAARVVQRLAERGIGVKGYFILGLPTETRDEMHATGNLVRTLWKITDRLPGRFRASVFEYRPYPGTPDWGRLMATGKYTEADLLNYTAVDLTSGGVNDAMRERDEFNFSTGIQFGEASVAEVRDLLAELSREQYDRKQEVAA